VITNTCFSWMLKTLVLIQIDCKLLVLQSFFFVIAIVMRLLHITFYQVSEQLLYGSVNIGKLCTLFAVDASICLVFTARHSS